MTPKHQPTPAEEKALAVPLHPDEWAWCFHCDRAVQSDWRGGAEHVDWVTEERYDVCRTERGRAYGLTAVAKTVRMRFELDSETGRVVTRYYTAPDPHERGP